MHQSSVKYFIQELYFILQCTPCLNEESLRNISTMRYRELSRMLEVFQIMKYYNSSLLPPEDMSNNNLVDIIYLCSSIGCKYVYFLISDLQSCGMLNEYIFDKAISNIFECNVQQRAKFIDLVHSLTKLNKDICIDYLHKLFEIKYDYNKLSLLTDTTNILKGNRHGAEFLYKYIQSILYLDYEGITATNIILEICVDHRIICFSYYGPVYQMILSKDNYSIHSSSSIQGRRMLLVTLRDANLLCSRNIKFLFSTLPDKMMESNDGFLKQFYVKLTQDIIETHINGILTQSKLDMMFSEVIDILS